MPGSLKLVIGVVAIIFGVMIARRASRRGDASRSWSLISRSWPAAGCASARPGRASGECLRLPSCRRRI